MVITKTIVYFGPIYYVFLINKSVKITQAKEKIHRINLLYKKQALKSAKIMLQIAYL